MSDTQRLRESIRNATDVRFPTSGHPAERTAARALTSLFDLADPHPGDDPGSGLAVAVAGSPWGLGPDSAPSGARPWMWVRIDPEGKGELTASDPALLYGLVHLLSDGLTPEQEKAVTGGLLLEASFSWNRPLFDYVLTQTARSARNFDARSYIERLARAGFTHAEVNALSTHLPFEEGRPNEYYSQFYSYCAGLNQFVDSTLTRGLYPHEYLRANLNRLKALAAAAREYGLKPGILCFEPRTLPDHFFERYPTLRGARVDHPFRSHLPRYTLAQDHPVARDHYRQLIRNLMNEVPDLAYMSVWTNDSGAGFEHTASLYVGRNGGPYLIREWRSHEKIADAAGASAVRWLRLLRDTAAEVNPDFEVSLRIEPFKVEHDTILDGMGDGLTLEAPSLLVRGYHLPYHHPRYEEQQSVAGSVFHTHLDEREKEKLGEFRDRGFEPKLVYSPGSGYNMEPLLGIPFPRMLDEKLTAMKDFDLRCISALGGLYHLEKTPYWPNIEVIRKAQLNADVPLDDWLQRIAARWAGVEAASDLVSLWDRVDEAVSYLPVLPLYSNFGFVWMRTWVRPLVPNLEAVPREDRLYFERFLVTTPNNPSINDLGRDVLFDLITQQSGQRMADQFDENVLPRVDDALQRAGELAEGSTGASRGVFTDLRDRIRALRCWATTQRNTCAWVAGVHGYLAAGSESEKDSYRDYIDAMIDLDVENTKDLLELWETSETEFMLVSEVGETSYIYGENFGEHLQRKIELTDRYREVEPFIDPEIIWRLP